MFYLLNSKHRVIELKLDFCVQDNKTVINISVGWCSILFCKHYKILHKKARNFSTWTTVPLVRVYVCRIHTYYSDIYRLQLLLNYIILKLFIHHEHLNSLLNIWYLYLLTKRKTYLPYLCKKNMQMKTSNVLCMGCWTKKKTISAHSRQYEIDGTAKDIHSNRK